MSLTAKWLLRVEGGLIAGIAIWFYATQVGNWWLFSALILVPDIAAVGYLASKRVGANCYNVVHSYISPAAVFAGLILLGQNELAQIVIIWVAHIGIDRLVGYGMKYDDNPKVTHLN